MKTSAWVSVGVAVLVLAGVAVLLLRQKPSVETLPAKDSAGSETAPQGQDVVSANDAAPSLLPPATRFSSTAPSTSPPSSAPTLKPLDGRLGNVRFGMDRKQVIMAFGQPDTEEGAALSYHTRGFAVFTQPQRGVAAFVIIAGGAVPKEAGANNFQGQTAEGVGIGSTEAEIVTAYGEPAFREQGGSTQTRLIYHGPKSSYRFTVDRDHGLVELSVVPPIPR